MATDVTDEEAERAPEIRTAEAWAEAKGFTPHFIESAAPFGGGTSSAVNPQFWKFAGAKASWPVGKELTEAEFDAAIAEAETQIYR